MMMRVAQTGAATRSLNQMAQVNDGNNAAVVVENSSNIIWNMMNFSQHDHRDHLNDLRAVEGVKVVSGMKQ